MPPTVGQLQTVSFFFLSPPTLSVFHQYWRSLALAQHWYLHSYYSTVHTHQACAFSAQQLYDLMLNYLCFKSCTFFSEPACTPGTEVLTYISNKEFHTSQGAYCAVTVFPSLIHAPPICVIYKSASALMLPSQSAISVEPLHQYLPLVSAP